MTAWPTLIDLTTRLDPEGKLGVVAEMLSQANDFLDYLPYTEANGVYEHTFTMRTSLPGGTWRAVNQGVPFSKSTTEQAKVALGELVSWSQIDRTICEQSGDVEAFRYSEDCAQLEGMSQTLVGTFFYGSEVTTPQSFTGLSNFYYTKSSSTAQIGNNVIDGGGSGSSNTSMWLTCFGDRTIHGLYPRDSKAGLEMIDHGMTTPAFDANRNWFSAYTTEFIVRAGLCPEDWRYGVRIANLDTTSAGLAGSNAPDLFALMAQMVMLPPTLGKVSNIFKTDAPDDVSPGIRPVIFANRTLRHWMDVQGMRDRNVLLSVNDYAGRPVDTFRGIPVAVVDQLLNTEDPVT